MKKYWLLSNKKIGSDLEYNIPEISQMFGECIAIFMVSVLKKYKKLNNFCELGPVTELI